MSWIKSALVYLGITGLIVGTVWLFWGKSIETAWKSHGEKPTKAAREVKAAAEKKAAKAMPEIREKTAPLSANIEKAKSGVAGILAHHADDNRKSMNFMAAQNDRRWAEIFKRSDKMKMPVLPKADIPAAVPAISPKEEKPSATAKKTAEKTKSEAPRRSKRLEEL
jgi:hypothetical protein